MSNNYETVFIANPVLSEAQMKEAAEKFKGVISAAGGEMVHEEDWGLRKLAYPIQKKTTGFYYMVQFSAEGNVVAKLETEFRRDERIMRFLTVKLDKFATEYAEKRRNLKSESKEA
ncbi:MAG: 30S ribosomal protein S6 [Salinivirgaceae bacterium]|nr:30S ribosomal protein S6 [Salinivirgaceae bacterium]